jgi:hypothetical protein
MKITAIFTVTSGVGLLFVRISAGITTGTMAILCAQPTDVVKIRMQAEVRKPGEKSRDGIHQIVSRTLSGFH